VLSEEVVFGGVLGHAEGAYRARIRARGKAESWAVKHACPLRFGTVLRFFVTAPGFWHQRLAAEGALPHFWTILRRRVQWRVNGGRG
jgi:hypothetical protein